MRDRTKTQIYLIWTESNIIYVGSRLTIAARSPITSWNANINRYRQWFKQITAHLWPEPQKKQWSQWNLYEYHILFNLPRMHWCFAINTRHGHTKARMQIEVYSQGFGSVFEWPTSNGCCYSALLLYCLAHKKRRPMSISLGPPSSKQIYRMYQRDCRHNQNSHWFFLRFVSIWLGCYIRSFVY